MLFADMPMEFDALHSLPGYNLTKRSSAERIARLREVLVQHGLEAYLIVDSDGHYTFYSQAPKDRRINYITNSEVGAAADSIDVGAMRCGDCRQDASGI
jgi:hypothetical protein